MNIVKLHSPSDVYIGDLEAVEALIWQRINGEHSCRVSVLSSDALADDITRGCIVLVPDADGTDQRFRISQPVESLDWIVLEGAHISQDLAQDMIVNRGWEDRTGEYVWPELVQSGISDMRFTGTSDIQTVNTVRIVRQSVMAGMIGTADNTFINRWGGELQRDNYTLNMMTRLGNDTPHEIAYRHNLLGIEVSEDESAIINRIVPTCVSASGGVLMLPEQWVDSPRISWTQVPHVRHMHFGDIRVGWSEGDETPAEYPTEADALAEMRSRISDMWTQGVDMPKVSARINVLDLSKTEEYKDIEPALGMRLGDSCQVVYANRVITQRLVAYRWDALGDDYQEITLGSVEPSLDSELAKWQTIIEERATDRAVERAYAPAVRYTRELNDAIASALGFYWTEVTDETGRTQLYYHDEVELEDSMIIETVAGPGQRAWTDTGWNGGSPDWKYGNTDRGLLIMDIVRARGVSADWINTGYLDASRIRINNERGLLDELDALDTLQTELEDALKIGSKNLALASDEERVSAQYLMTTIDLSEYLRPGHPYSVTVKGRKDVGIDFRLWFNGGAISGPSLEDRGDGLWAAQFDAPLQPPGTLEQDARQIRIYNFPSTAGITPSVIEWIMVTRGDQEYLFHVRAPEDIKADVDAAKQAADDAMDLAEANEAILTPMGLQVTALEGRTQQHYGLPPPTTYKTGDRWAIPTLTNHDLRFRTNAQLQAWGIVNSMLSGGEMLATRGREGTYDAADWIWISVNGKELKRVDRLMTDVKAGNILLSSQTRLSDGGWQVGDFAVHDYQYSRWQHRDGSYTQISPNPGLEQYIAGRGRRYHNLMYITTVSGQDTLTKWVQLPDEFKGKEFEVFMAVSDSTEHVPSGGDVDLDNRSAIRRLVATVSPEATIDYGEAKVPYMCYKLSVDIHKVINDPINSPWRLTRAIGIMIAIA